ncbi:MAG TPA: MFS transporter, partial [Chloroflexota bacterium]
NQVHAWGWTSPLFLGCMLASAAKLAVFAVIELRSPSPMLDLHVFRTRTFSASVVSATLNYLSIFTMTFLLPFFLIQARGLSVAAAGLMLSAQPLVMAATAPLSGILSDRIGARLPATLGMLIIAIGLGLLSRLGLDTPLLAVVAILVLIGIGVGLASSALFAALGAVTSAIAR